MGTKAKISSLPVGEQKQLDKLLTKLRKHNTGKDTRFDVNLAEGEIAEKAIRDLFTGGVTIEVKRDFKVSQTGNIAIEEEYRGRPSGIATTEASVWAFVLDGPGFGGEVKILIDIDRLRCILSKIERTVYGGDNKWAKMKLLPITTLLKACTDCTKKGKRRDVTGSYFKGRPKQQAAVRADGPLRRKTKAKRGDA